MTELQAVDEECRVKDTKDFDTCVDCHSKDLAYEVKNLAEEGESGVRQI